MSQLNMWSKWSSKIKNKVILKVSLDLKIHFIYTVSSYHIKKFSILIYVVLFCPKNPNLYIADTLFRNLRCPFRQVWLCVLLYYLSLPIDKTIWHNICCFLLLVVLFSCYISINHRLNLIARLSKCNLFFFTYPCW